MQRSTLISLVGLLGAGCGSSSVSTPGPTAGITEVATPADSASEPPSRPEVDGESANGAAFHDAPEGRASRVLRCGAGDDAACLTLGGEEPISTGDLATRVVAEWQVGARPEGGTIAGCVAGDGKECSLVAHALEESPPGDCDAPETMTASRRFHRLACAQGHWFSCNNLTLNHCDALGEKVSRRMFDASCGEEDPAACYWAGIRYTSGFGAEERDLERGYAMVTRACQLGYGTACYSLANAYSAGIHGFPTNLERAVDLLEQGCDGGSPDACSELEADEADLRQSCADGIALHCAVLERRGRAADAPRSP